MGTLQNLGINFWAEKIAPAAATEGRKKLGFLRNVISGGKKRRRQLRRVGKKFGVPRNVFSGGKQAPAAATTGQKKLFWIPGTGFQIPGT